MESDQIEISKATERIQLEETLMQIAKTVSCPVCDQSGSTYETTDFCGCLPKTKTIHLKCIRLLPETDTGNLYCRECNNKFNQYFNDVCDQRKFISEWSILFPILCCCLLVCTLSAYLQVGIFVNFVQTLTDASFIAGVVLHFLTVVSFSTSMFLMYNVNARNCFSRYLDKTQARSALQYVFACTLFTGLSNTLPAVAFRNLYQYSYVFSLWMLFFCAVFGPVVTIFVLRNSYYNLRGLRSLRFELRKLDMYSPTKLRRDQNKKTTV